MYDAEIIFTILILLLVSIFFLMYYKPLKSPIPSFKNIQNVNITNTDGSDVDNVQELIDAAVILPCPDQLKDVINVYTGARRISTTYNPTAEVCTLPASCPNFLAFPIDTNGGTNIDSKCDSNVPLCRCTNQLSLEPYLIGVWETPTNGLNFFNVSISNTYSSPNTQDKFIPSNIRDSITGNCVYGTIGYVPTDPYSFISDSDYMEIYPPYSNENIACVNSTLSGKGELMYNIQNKDFSLYQSSLIITDLKLQFEEKITISTDVSSEFTITANTSLDDFRIIFNKQINNFQAINGVLTYRTIDNKKYSFIKMNVLPQGYVNITMRRLLWEFLGFYYISSTRDDFITITLNNIDNSMIGLSFIGPNNKNIPSPYQK